MSHSITQAAALGLLTLALTRSSTSFHQTHAWLGQSKGKNPVIYLAYGMTSLIAALPEFLCSAKAYEFAAMLAKV